MTASRPKNFELPRRLGKAEARQEFGPLVESVAAGGGPVEISDYGKVVAVLVNVHKYQWLLQQAKRQTTKPKKELCGAIVIHDDLEMLSQQLRDDYEKSLEETARNL